MLVLASRRIKLEAALYSLHSKTSLLCVNQKKKKVPGNEASELDSEKDFKKDSQQAFCFNLEYRLLVLRTAQKSFLQFKFIIYMSIQLYPESNAMCVKEGAGRQDDNSLVITTLCRGVGQRISASPPPTPKRIPPPAPYPQSTSSIIKTDR